MDLRPGAMSEDDADSGVYDGGTSMARAHELAARIESSPDQAVGEGGGWGTRWDHFHDSTSGERHQRRNLSADAIPDGYGDPRTW
ncbi:MAG: hypothetical protein ACLFWF_14035 [Alphaproteobacteria bacterium]